MKKICSKHQYNSNGVCSICNVRYYDIEQINKKKRQDAKHIPVSIQSAIIKKELDEEEYQELEHQKAWAEKLGMNLN